MSARSWPGKAEFALRLVLAAAFVLVAGRLGEPLLTRALLPAARASLELLSADFHVLGTGISGEPGGLAIWLQANLTHSLVIGGEWVRPFGAMPGSAGGIQVTLTAGSLWFEAQLLLALLLAWPAHDAVEWLRRVLWAIPFAVIVWLLVVPATLLAELWFPLHNRYAPAESWPLLQWSRAMMGGGGTLLAMLAAAAVLTLARRSTGARNFREGAAG
jgi:hypothetical protein